MNYTKGKWAARLKPVYDQNWVTTLDGNQSRMVAMNIPNPEDACLISAAPEMYEALKLYQEHQEGTHGHYCWKCAEAISKALTKAEGE